MGVGGSVPGGGTPGWWGSRGTQEAEARGGPDAQGTDICREDANNKHKQPLSH